MTNQTQDSLSSPQSRFLETIFDPSDESSKLLYTISSANFNGAIPDLIIQYPNATTEDLVPGGYLLIADTYYLITRIDENIDPTTTDTVSYNVWYIDAGVERSKTILSGLKLFTDGTELQVRRDDWDAKSLGSSGWTITTEGNSVFSNVAVRGRIEATEGYFDGRLFVGDPLDADSPGSMRIGTNVDGTLENPGTQDGIFINANNYWYDDGKFSLGSGTKKIYFDGTDVVITSAVTIQGGVTATSFGIDANNYWNTAGNEGDFRVGSATSYLLWNMTNTPNPGDGNLEVKGTINATAGNFSGDITSTATITGGIIAGASITGSTITGGSLRIGSASTTSVFKVDPTSGLWLGAQNFVDAPFSVSLNGYLKASSGMIAGMALDGASISFGSGPSYVALSSAGTTGSSYALWAGSEIASEASFSVKRNGSLHATSANISGTISATNSTFSGSITAGNGSIGGWLIGPTSISKPITASDHLSIYVGTGTYGNANTPFFISSEGKFSLKDKLGFNGNDLTVKGEINATSGNFTGNIKVDTGGKIYVGSSPTTGQRVVVSDTGITGVDNSGVTVFNLPATGTSPPTITNFNVLEAKITGAGPNAYLIAGTTGSNATNIVVRGDKSNDQAAAIYNTIDGDATTATTGDGFYIDDTGKFRFATGNNAITGSDGNLTITGRVIASTIRGSDVYADSAQLGGSEFGWVSGSGGIFSGTDQSTTYLQSGFYANPILNIEQEVWAEDNVIEGVFVNAKGTVKEYNISGTTTPGDIAGVTISASPRSLFATFSEDVLNVKKGYQVYTGSGTSKMLVGIVEEVIDLRTVRLKSVSSRFIVNESFSIQYVKSIITTQFFTGFTEGRKISIESPEGTSYDISAIDHEAGASDNKTITYQIPPVWTSIYEKKPLTYAFKTAYLTESSGKLNDITINIQSISAQKSTIDGIEYYDAKLSVKASDIFVDGELNLDVGQNIFIGNIPNDSNFFYPLINSYFPIIDIIENGLNYDILIYADGYLSFTTANKYDEFAEYSVNKFNSFNNKITLTTASNHRFFVGQVVNLKYLSTPLLDNSWSLEPRIITEVTQNTFTFQYVFPNVDNISINPSTSKANSFPTLTKKSYDKDYAIWIGANNPTDAPFSIDAFGQNVKIKNLEVTGTVNGFYYDIIELDDFSGNFNGRNNTFLPRYNQKKIVLDNPMRLSVSLNGVMQSAFIQNREYVWQTGFLSYKGFTVDGDGNLKFSESPPSGSTINVKVLPGPNKNKTSRIYPFKAVDVALG
jgi:hypothetical protein